MLVIRYRFKTRAVFESGFRLQLEELILKLASAPSAFLKAKMPPALIQGPNHCDESDGRCRPSRWGRRVFFDIAAERLLADRQIGGGALQVEPGARLAKLGEFSRIKLFADMLF